MRTIARVFFLPFVVMFAAACPGPGSGGLPCTVDGKVYKSGESFPSPDGCNTCHCLDGRAACTEKACLPDQGLTDGATGGIGGDGATGDEVMCAAAMSVFPTFSKVCGGDGECAIGVHQINCCGSQKAIGMNRAEQGRFDAAEKTCRSQYPRCGCPTLPTIAEDDRSETQGTIQVRCSTGACMTYVK